jgi:hypothetical protein
VEADSGGDGFEYDVCFSFAGEQRGYVDRVSRVLQQGGLRVFYDLDEQVDLWGKDLYAHLAEVYETKARYCVLFASTDYARKTWTNHERENAQARALRESYEYILPARFDDTKIPGLRATTGYIDLRTIGAEEFAVLVARKVASSGRPPARPPRHGHRPFQFDGRNYLDPVELVRAMTRAWEAGAAMVTGPEAAGLDAWLADLTQDRPLAANVLLTGDADTRLAELAAGLTSDEPPRFHGVPVNLAGLTALARQTLAGSAAANAVLDGLTPRLFAIYARHAGDADLAELPERTALLLREVSDAALALVRDHDSLDGFTTHAVGTPLTSSGSARSHRLRARILLAALDPRYPAAIATELAALPPRSRGTDWDAAAGSPTTVDQAIALEWSEPAAAAVNERIATERRQAEDARRHAEAETTRRTEEARQAEARRAEEARQGEAHRAEEARQRAARHAEAIATEAARRREVRGWVTLGIVSVAGPFLVMAVAAPAWNNNPSFGLGIVSLTCFGWLVSSASWFSRAWDAAKRRTR